MYDKKSIVIYAHYYFPDIASTGQILKELAEGMLTAFDVTVICVVPSYEGTIAPKYKKRKYYEENMNGVKVIRVRVPEFSKTNKLSRTKNIMIYFFRAVWATGKVDRADYIYSISQPPILGGILGVIGKWIKNARFIYNIQDFNPEQIMAIDYSKNKFLIKIAFYLDKFACTKADKIIVVGRDMMETYQKRFEGRKIPPCCFINNWIDESKIYPLDKNDKRVQEFKLKYEIQNKTVVMYSGNIGLYYDLENLMRVIETFKNRNDVVFAFVGAGAIKDKLTRYKEKNDLKNVIFLPYQKKEELIYSLNAGDIHWCVNAKGIKGISVPSKLYGIMAVGKPVLGVLEKKSEARLLIEETGCGYVTEPQNYRKIKKLLYKLIDEKDEKDRYEMGQRGRKYLTENLTKEVSIKKYIAEIKG